MTWPRQELDYGQAEIDRPNLEAEVSYIAGTKSTYGRAGTVRADVVFTNSQGDVTLIVDYKTGGQRITKKQASKYYDDWPENDWNLYQVKPNEDPVYVQKPD